ncbi:hypothetical protein QAD02_022208, partial [Eretmocerus hayati]
REASQRDAVERERRLRMEAEARVREATVEAERACSRVHHLQRELARMEENVKGLQHHKQRVEQLKQEKNALTLSYEGRLHQCQGQISALQLENESMRGQLRGLEAAGCGGESHATLLARLASLESEHAALARDADAQRRQYERCLDDVANQVVRALLSQKGLREEIGALQRRIRELESQNRTLSGLLAQAAAAASPTNSSAPGELVQSILEAGPAALVAALGLADSSWIPLARPRSLNLQIPVMATTKCRRARPLGQKPSEEEGSESPESGNRDEGYSTMSSDVQGEGARQGEPPRGLEEVKEATDETEADLSPDARLVSLDATDPDVLFLPLNLTLGLSSNPRHSYPPAKEILTPYQHVMRSFSDSHLCLKLTAAAATSINPYVTSPASSLLLVDEDGWDAEYVQQWLRLDDSRSAQQQHRDLLELEYDRAELEDWSFSLSSEDLAANEINCNGIQIKETSVSTPALLPPIKEHNHLELEEDANECLWNGASYLSDRTGGELVALLMDNNRSGGPWPYASSPGASWSSSGDEEICNGGGSKRSSGALSGCCSSGDEPDSPSIGTDFTRDFYRLVKFESSRSLASNSSRGGCKSLPANASDREQQLHSVLSFIAEQHKYLPPAATNPSTLTQLDNDQIHADTRPPSSNDESSSNRQASGAFYGDSDEVSDESRNGPSEKSAEELLDEIPVPPLAPEERIVSAIACNGGISYTTVAPSELGAVPEEDEEAATSSTPSTVVSPARASVLIEGRDCSLSFHERATSKDVIDELNRMIKSGDDNNPSRSESQVALEKLDIACCCPTGWVHIERDIDFTDPKARANLLDVMLASSESSSATSSSGSAGSDSGDEPPDYRHLHRLHRFRRQKKASAVHRVLRLPSNWASARPSIIGRGGEFFVRYGDKEREAVASFDFLDEMGISSSSSPRSSLLSNGSSSNASVLDSPNHPDRMKLSPL